MTMVSKIINRFSIRVALSIAFLWGVALTAAFSQGIVFISLDYSSAVRMDNAQVKVHISCNADSTYSVRVERVSLFPKIDQASLKPDFKPAEKKITITGGQFQAIVNSLQRIKNSDIIGGPHPLLLDGSSCSISYGAHGASIRYYVKTPEHETDKRNLNDFLRTYRLILKTAELDPKILGL